MFYRGVTKLEGNSAIEFQTLKRFVKSDDGEEKVSLSDFRKISSRSSEKVF